MINNAYATLAVSTLGGSYSDDFSSFNSAFWQWVDPTSNVTQQVTGNQVQISISSGAETNQWGGVCSLQGLTLVGSAFSWEFTETGDAATDSSGVYVGVFLNSIPVVSSDISVVPGSLWMSCYQGQLVCGYNADPFSTVWVNQITYDPVNHKYARIRESSGTVYFDASPDNSTWTNVGSVADDAFGFSLTAFYSTLEGYTWATPSPATVLGIGDFSYATPTLGQPAACTNDVVIVNSTGTVISVCGNDLPACIYGEFSYGSSSESIRASLTASIRAAAGDPLLNVIYLP